MKYAVCGPKTAIGLPFRVCSPASRSALLVALGMPKPEGPFAIASRSACSGGPVTSTGVRLAQSIAGFAAGFTGPRFVRYGAATCELVGASTSFLKWRSSKIARAVAAFPSVASIACRPQ